MSAERILHPDRSALHRFGFELRRLRKERGYSLAGLAARVFVSADLLQRIELAERYPSRDLASRLDEVLQARGAVSRGWQEVDAERRAHAEMAMRSAQDSGHDRSGDALAPAGFGGIDEMNRRELLRIASIAGGLTAISAFPETADLERLNAWRLQRADLDSRLISDLGSLNDHLWQVFVLSRVKSAVFPLVRDHLGVLTDGLSRSVGTGSYRQLCGFASSAFQLCGEILFDGNHYTEAAHCYLLAATAGREAGQNDLWACALTRHAFIGLYERRFDKATPLLEIAAGLARRGDPGLATRHWVAVVQAQAFAGLGDLALCQRALASASQIRELSGIIHNGGWMRFHGSRLAEEQGTCYLHLGRLDLAEAALTDALGRGLSARRRGSVLVDLAILGVNRRDFGNAISYADAAIEIADQTGSGVVARRLLELQALLAPHAGDRLRELSRRIAAVGSRTNA